MIKTRILFSGAFLVLAFFMVIISVFRLTRPEFFQGNIQKPVFAVNDTEKLSLSEIGQVNDENSKVDYILPYPGILPDHPLYWLKMIRDRINLIFTSDPLAKFELMLLYADKRIGAGKVLIVGNQTALGVTTITKAEKYLLQASQQLQLTSQNKEIDNVILTQFAKAFLKHQEIISQLKDKVSDNERIVLDNALNINQTLFDNHYKKYINQDLFTINQASSSAEASESANLKAE